MKKIYREDADLYLRPGNTIIRRIVTDRGNKLEQKMIITKSPYMREWLIDGRKLSTIDVLYSWSDKPSHYYISDLFNGDVYLLGSTHLPLPEELFDI
jgi:hypothetical protein